MELIFSFLTRAILFVWNGFMILLGFIAETISHLAWIVPDRTPCHRLAYLAYVMSCVPGWMRGYIYL